MYSIVSECGRGVRLNGQQEADVGERLRAGRFEPRLDAVLQPRAVCRESQRPDKAERVRFARGDQDGIGVAVIEGIEQRNLHLTAYVGGDLRHNVRFEGLRALERGSNRFCVEG